MVLAYIPVSDTKFATVDLEDLDKIIGNSWCINSRGYAHSNIKGVHTMMHKVILASDLVDHIDGNKLHNSKQNLRPSNKQRNGLNRKIPLHKYKGVFKKSANSWQAILKVSKVNFYLGSFNNPEDAARAYDMAAFEWAGSHGRYNFPEELPIGT